MYFIFSSDIGLIVSDIKSSRRNLPFPAATLFGFREIVHRWHFRYKNDEKESAKNAAKGDSSDHPYSCFECLRTIPGTTKGGVALRI